MDTIDGWKSRYGSDRVIVNDRGRTEKTFPVTFYRVLDIIWIPNSFSFLYLLLPVVVISVFPGSPFRILPIHLSQQYIHVTVVWLSWDLFLPFGTLLLNCITLVIMTPELPSTCHSIGHLFMQSWSRWLADKIPMEEKPERQEGRNHLNRVCSLHCVVGLNGK